MGQEPMLRNLRSTGLAFAAALAAGVLALAQPAHAGFSLVGSTLTLLGEVVPGEDVDIFDIIVAPNGDVTTFGVVGAHGTTFSGITRIVVYTGVGGSDTVRMAVEHSTIDVDINTGTFGNDTVEIDLVVPGGGPATPTFKIDAGGNQDNVTFGMQSFTDDLILNLQLLNCESPGVELEQLSGSAWTNIHGQLGVIKAFGGADFTLQGSLGIQSGSSGKIEVDGDLDTDLVIQAGSTSSIDLIVKGDLTGSPQLLGAKDSKVEIEGNSTGSAFMTGTAFGSSLNYSVKGSLDGSPVVRGLGFPDSIQLKVEGSIAGSPLIDGGSGFPNSCDASPGVTVINCN
jgi:hypothetical protein